METKQERTNTIHRLSGSKRCVGKKTGRRKEPTHNCSRVDDYNLQGEEEGAAEWVYINFLQMCSPFHVDPEGHPTA
jgi:hypothetical protein